MQTNKDAETYRYTERHTIRQRNIHSDTQTNIQAYIHTKREQQGDSERGRNRQRGNKMCTQRDRETHTAIENTGRQTD